MTSVATMVAIQPKEIAEHVQRRPNVWNLALHAPQDDHGDYRMSEHQIENGLASPATGSMDQPTENAQGMTCNESSQTALKMGCPSLSGDRCALSLTPLRPLLVRHAISTAR
jgi:hypothetical protein